MREEEGDATAKGRSTVSAINCSIVIFGWRNGVGGVSAMHACFYTPALFAYRTDYEEDTTESTGQNHR
jgi:hypothetical protein